MFSNVVMEMDMSQFEKALEAAKEKAVSYTHLDVYKRQRYTAGRIKRCIP